MNENPESKPFSYLSVCSGFGGAELAFEPLGWKCVAVAEVDSAARAVLKHRYPEVKNLGDFTKIGREDVGAIDALVGGTPCQSFSIAGLRGGLGDERGNLSLEFLRLADRTRPRWILWENVPGVLSSTSHIAPNTRPPEIDLDGPDGPKDGEEIVVEDEYDADEDHAFACFLAGLSEFGYGYAYGTLDAQHFGVPQRRRRVFVVGCLGDWASAAAVLFEFYSLQGNLAPRRETGKVITGNIAESIAGSLGGGAKGDGVTTSTEVELSCQFESPGRYWDGSDIADTLDASNASNASKQQAMPEKRRFQAVITGPLMNSGKAAGSATQQDAETGMLVTAPLSQRPYSDRGAEEYGLIPTTVHSLRADGFDASEDGTGRGTPLVPVVYAIQERTCCENPDAGPDGVGVRGDSTAYTVKARQVPQAVAFRAAGQDGFTPSEISPPVVGTDGGGCGVPTVCFDSRQDPCDYGSQSGSLSGQSPQSMAVAFESRFARNGRGAPSDIVPPLKAQSGKGDASPLICFDTTQVTSPGNYSNPKPGDACHPLASGSHPPAISGMQVRRLTPTECERLQGLPDDWTLVPYHGKPMADGPRYRMIGNGFAIPVVSWIGQRIHMIDSLKDKIPVDSTSR